MNHLDFGELLSIVFLLRQFLKIDLFIYVILVVRAKNSYKFSRHMMNGLRGRVMKGYRVKVQDFVVQNEMPQ